MKNIFKLFLVVLVAIPLGLQAQNCSQFQNSRKPVQPYRYNTASKSATCMTGRKYEFVLPVIKGLEYRIQFYASPIFNNDIDFKIIDMSTNETVVDVPGKLGSNQEAKANGETALQDFFNEKKKKIEHPYFDFTPESSTSLKIMLDVKEVKPPEPTVMDDYGYGGDEYGYGGDEYGYGYEYEPTPAPTPAPAASTEETVVPIEKNKGCISVYIMDKDADDSEGFN
ncbi:MAG: hypothetical protein MJ211_15460 [Bacteroidales bacterium]|nr:hypothetical protein [Bacteroidales bacterium]